MNLRKYWPVAVLFAAVLIYFFIGGEDTVPNKPSELNQLTEKLSIDPSPAATSWKNSTGPVYPGQNNVYQPQIPGNYRFRDDDGKQPAKPQNDFTPYPSPDTEYQNYPNSNQFQSPEGAMTYRFRPVEKNRQSKRWVGNYAQKPAPYPQPQNRYPYKENVPSQGRLAPNTPLWADDWHGQ